MPIRDLLARSLITAGCLLGGLVGADPASRALARGKQTDPIPDDGSRLPRPEPAFRGSIGESYKDSTPSYPQPLKSPKGSPNVLLILLDDVGFGMCSTFGTSTARMPSLT